LYNNIQLKMNSLKLGILGSGSWATAIVKVLQHNNISLNWYVRNSETIDYIKTYGNNPKYLTSTELNNDLLNMSDDIDEVVDNSQILILVIPSAFLRESLEQISVDIHNKYFVSAIKGLVPRENLLISDYLNKYFNVSLQNVAAIVGPCHAEEVAQEKLSYLTIAGHNRELNQHISVSLHSRFIETIISNDLEGAEYAAVMKNIYAVASGISHGLRLGDNYQAVLVSNAAQEMERFLQAIKPDTLRDIKSSAYLGDLLVTVYSQFSRNRTFGNLIGKGNTVRAAQAEMLMIAEGYYAAQSIYEINKSVKASIPIAETTYNILYQREDPRRAFNRLNKLLR
jgi:glycerol-3-phosphate dehydrogenase (NAD(P)+)